MGMSATHELASTVKIGEDCMANRKTPAALGIFALAMSWLLLFHEVTGKVNAAGKEPLTITSIQAKLFFDGKGAVSEDVLGDPPPQLWNTPIGEGSAGAPSHSVLILVEVNGRAETTEHQRRVRFTAKYNSSTAAGIGTKAPRAIEVSESVPIGSFGPGGKSYVAFWLYDTGCTPVALTAQIAGQTQASKMEKTIPFRCGE